MVTAVTVMRRLLVVSVCLACLPLVGCAGGTEDQGGLDASTVQLVRSQADTLHRHLTRMLDAASGCASQRTRARRVRCLTPHERRVTANGLTLLATLSPLDQGLPRACANTVQLLARGASQIQATLPRWRTGVLSGSPALAHTQQVQGGDIKLRAATQSLSRLCTSP